MLQTVILASFSWGLLSQVSGQLPPEIDGSSIHLENGTALVFQFHAAAGGVEDFVIETSGQVDPSGTWVPTEAAAVTAQAAGFFQVTLNGKKDRLFCRIRVLEGAGTGPALLINEVMSDNVTAFSDEAGAFWDWIELYNPNDEAANLNQYALSDDLAMPGKWRFPDVLIQPHGYLLIYASDLNLTNSTQPLHTNFKLKGSGETLVLSDPGLHSVDQFVVPSLNTDQSVGRSPDGGAILQFYGKAQTTPGRENGLGNQPAIASPVFTPDGGFFDGPVSVQLTPVAADQTIHYTLDGSAPTVQSPVFLKALNLEHSAVIRALAVDRAGHTSAADARTFLIGVAHSLPILSLATAPTNMAFRNGYLYGLGPKVLSSQNEVLQTYPYSGSNAWLDREVEVQTEFFETNRTVGFRQRAGMKIFGGWGSRGYPQKSLALFARRSYGAGKFNYRIFPDQNIDQFEAFVLRGSGNDNQGTHQTPPRPPITEFGPVEEYGSYFVNGNFTLMRDAMMQRLVARTGLDTQGYRPAAVYLNGEYWGIYNIREKMNEGYVLSHHELPSDRIDLIDGYGTVNAGSGGAYTQMRQYLSSRNLADDANYTYVAETFLDIDNFIDYHLAVIYFQNFDIGNIKCWRPQTPRGRFRWMLFDQDYGFNLWPPEVYLPAMARDYADYDNMFDFYTAGSGSSTAWPNGGGRTLLLRNMLKNAQFKARFIRRCADLLNTAFREPVVTQTIEQMAAVIRPEIAAHLQRWSWDEIVKRGFGLPHQREFKPFTQATWETNLSTLTGFAVRRPAKLRQDCLNHFQLKNGLGTLRIQAQPAGSAEFLLNSLSLAQTPWEGIYFVDSTNVLQMVPRVGYQLAGWTTPRGDSNEPILHFSIGRDRTNEFIAHLEPVPTSTPTASGLIITEIQYHPQDGMDSGDWVEVKNGSTAPVNLAGWILRDGSDEHAFALPDRILPAGARLVLCQDEYKFHLFHPFSVPAVGNFKFGLDNNGGLIRLFAPNGAVAVSIRYDDELPWPVQADGGGSTLQLIDAGLEPSQPGSWRASTAPGGEPGE